MDVTTRAELKSISNELADSIRELSALSNKIRAEFKGIGNEYCAVDIEKAVYKYQSIKSIIDKVIASPDQSFGFGSGGGFR